MNDLPSAIVEHPRPPLRFKPARAKAIRRLLAIVLVTSAAFACWKLIKSRLRSAYSTRLELRQERAREKIGKGLDELFARQLEAESSMVELAASFEVSAELGASYDVFGCGPGLDAAFEEALGKDVVTFAQGIQSTGYPRLAVNAKLTPSGQRYQLAHASETYPGIRMSAELSFLGRQIHVDVQPMADVEFKVWRPAGPFEKVSADEVANGVIQGACKQVGYALLEALTTWERPAAPPRANPIEECERGVRCRENAEVLEATDRATAAKLHARACVDGDEEACKRSAELEVERAHGGGSPLEEVRVTLERACERDLAAACAGMARLALLPAEPGASLSVQQRSEALALYLRACDLGSRDACAAAAPLLERTELAEAAPLLTGATSARSRTLGMIFALRWGQWTLIDRGRPTVWVTSKPARVPRGAIVTRFEVGTLPAGVVAPEGATTVYAVALSDALALGPPCDSCSPRIRGESRFAMRSNQCVCALEPKQQSHR